MSIDSNQLMADNEIVGVKQAFSCYYFKGGPAYADAVLDKLLTSAQVSLPEIKRIMVSQVFVVRASSLSQDVLLDMARLLSATHVEAADLALLSLDHCFRGWVAPRVGTTSSWCSKATDIFHQCGLLDIDRIEQLFQFDFTLAASSSAMSNFDFQILFDRMTQSWLSDAAQIKTLFSADVPESFSTTPVLSQGESALQLVDRQLGLNLTPDQRSYLLTAFQALQCDPTDVELMMFAQINSEHCRHHIFNATWEIDGEVKDLSLFSMIRHTYATNPGSVLIAYSDNAAVINGSQVNVFACSPISNLYGLMKQTVPFVFKVETHNHPTAISPYPGAATGSGGEMRDESATGRGAMPKMGMVGYMVSHLHQPGVQHSWEILNRFPKRITSSLDIMLEAPLGASDFNNEFGRPVLTGFFRSFTALADATTSRYWGYHKPIMIAGGVGAILPEHVEKRAIPVGALIVVLGGPAMAIGLGGGSASSRLSSDQAEALDFSSVQRANPQMQRCTQELIRQMVALGVDNPILSIHDVGAGGLCNAIPEIAHSANRGCRVELRQIPCVEPGLSPLGIWCNEAQERYVCAIAPEKLKTITRIAERERVPIAVVGEFTAQKKCVVYDSLFDNYPVDQLMSLFLHDLPPIRCRDQRQEPVLEMWDSSVIDWSAAPTKVLSHPTVGDKRFLITIADRTQGGLVVRDQLVGPWQIPVSDVACVASGFWSTAGEAMAVGERSPVAIIDSKASARLAIGEALTNIMAADIDALSNVVLSANWMAAADVPGQGSALYDAVQAAAMEYCPALGIAIPVGKDSLSMRTCWVDDLGATDVVSPVSLVATAAAVIEDVSKTLTPELKTDQGETALMFIDLSNGKNDMGGSILSEVYQRPFTAVPDVCDPHDFKRVFSVLRILKRQGCILAYHDRSDGGLLTTVIEMMFAGHVGVTLDLEPLGDDPLAAAFTEGLGIVIQVSTANRDAVVTAFECQGVRRLVYEIGCVNDEDSLSVFHGATMLFQRTRSHLGRCWSKTHYHLTEKRDNPSCARSMYDAWLVADDPGIRPKLVAEVDETLRQVYWSQVENRPRVAILREQGSHSYNEMAAALTYVGFDAIDVSMHDLIVGSVRLEEFDGLAVCGGFAYGDVLGAGHGWASVILHNPELSQQFSDFFASSNRFVLGVCNGCQMLSSLKSLIPGASHWPLFKPNLSNRFEARLSLVQVQSNSSIFLSNLSGSVLPIVVSHAQGRVDFDSHEDLVIAQSDSVLAFVDNRHDVTMTYPSNPNGSMQGMTAFTAAEGRVLIMMPHPERSFLTRQLSTHPEQWGDASPWTQMFLNARQWIDSVK